MKKFLFRALLIAAVGLVGVLLFSQFVYQDAFFFLKREVRIDPVVCQSDRDSDGINDMLDIVLGARSEVDNRTVYKSTYYKGGFPPDSEGVCTDVVWRALKNAGYDLKQSMDDDIAEKKVDYMLGIVIPDPNIDFRRVKNQFVFFRKYATSLTTEVKPFNKRNLYQWQAGDIVVLKNSDHVAIVSDRRGKNGVPYIIHNSSTFAMEENLLLKWSRKGRIIGHFRYPQNTLE